MGKLLGSLFGVGVRVRNSLYDSGSLKAQQLVGPVISIGNISVGGSGKTPFTILLGDLLKKRGIKFDVLSRGYGRESQGTAIVDPNGSAREFGDEPLLIARKLDVPVVLGEERYAAGKLAEEKFGVQLHLLDDGFQHRQLAREFDIVLVTPEDLRDHLIPSGRLREPLSSLRRADAVVLAGGADEGELAKFGKPLWRVRRGIFPKNVPERPIAFCGIARPQNFLLQLRTAGVELIGEALFRDHHPYSEKDIEDLLAMRRQSEAGGFVTTEKDAINLGERLQRLAPVCVIPVKMNLLDADQALNTLLNTLAQRGKPLT